MEQLRFEHRLFLSSLETDSFAFFLTIHFFRIWPICPISETFFFWVHWLGNNTPNQISRIGLRVTAKQFRSDISLYSVQSFSLFFHVSVSGLLIKSLFEAPLHYRTSSSSYFFNTTYFEQYLFKKN